MEPIRTCIACQKKGHKKHFIKFTKNKCGKIEKDENQYSMGRGYYICDSVDCGHKLRKNRRLEQILGKENIDIIANKIGGTKIE